MYSIEEIVKIVEDTIINEEYNSIPKGLYEPIEYVMSMGGKRLRPVLTLMSLNLYDDNLEKAFHPALGIETFHNFTLLHDDIMDGADLRRNKSTVHKKWDENTAILSGDAMMVKAYRHLLKYKGQNFREILEIFTQTASEVCEGQQYDMNFEKFDKVSINDYLEMIRLKTAVLLAASLKIGALVANASKHDIENLYKAGLNVGMAFQLQDDYLDAFGDVKVFGKAIGGDIICNKKTFLLISAFNNADEKTSKNIKTLLNLGKDNKEEKINGIIEIYKKLNIPKLTQDKMDEYLEKAFFYFKNISVDNSKKVHLLDFARKLSQRKK
jgi:geranylgeranyl diphosphate synthase type II